MTYIYTLSHPLTKEVRYIGKSNSPKERLNYHMSDLNKYSHKKNWISKLKLLNLKPIIEIIDEVHINEWRYWEKFWISQFKTWGFNLTNSTEGGDGLTFRNSTTFKKGHLPWNKGIKGYSTSKKGSTIPQEVKDKISSTLKERESKKKRKVTQYSIEMKKIKTFNSITEAISETKIKGIGNAISGRVKTAGGYIWQ